MATKYRSPEGDLTYRVGSWTRSLFDDEVNGGGALQATVETTKSNRPKDHDQHERLTREVFGRLYGFDTREMDDASVPETARSWARALHAEAADLPEWKDAEMRANGDAWMAGLGAAAIGNVFRDRLPELPPDTSEDEATIRALDALEAAGGLTAEDERARDAAAKRMGEAQDRAADVSTALAASMSAVRSALRKAIAGASKDMGDTTQAMRGLGWSPTGASEAEKALVRKRLSDSRVREICKLAGRFVGEVRARRSLGGRGAEEVHSIEQGRDIGRLLPSELVGLSLPMGLEALAAKLADGRAMQYAVRGNEKPTQGPLVICCDESGSMRGMRDVWAKAFALGLMMLAREQGRPFALVHFASGVDRVDVFAEPRTASVEKILDAVSYFQNGGTDIGAALGHAVRAIKRGEFRFDHAVAGGVQTQKGYWLRRSDIVLVTDGCDGGDLDPIGAMLSSAGASLYTCTIECPCPESLRALSERVVSYTADDLGSTPDLLLSL